MGDDRGAHLSSIPSHWMDSAVFGAGLIWFIGRSDVPARKGLGADLMLTAMLMHGVGGRERRDRGRQSLRLRS